jgi:hypothetical protein
MPTHPTNNILTTITKTTITTNTIIITIITIIRDKGIITTNKDPTKETTITGEIIIQIIIKITIIIITIKKRNKINLNNETIRNHNFLIL